MSWLARSLAKSLNVDDDNEDNNNINSRNRESPKDREDEEQHQIESSETPGRGVKEDLSELTKTLTRQLWGVASFLAPPPSQTSSPPPSPPPPLPPHELSSTDHSISDWNRWESSDRSVSGETSDPNISDSSRIDGIRSDFAEIGGKFNTGISKLSNNKAVSEFSKIVSSLIPFGSEDDSEEKYMIGGAVGVTDEVLAFARNIAMHPETWLDFPLADDEDSDDFDMSDAQQEHALAVERLAPRLAALRIELCPGYMSEGCFWKIYFVLLHPRLNKHDADLLSTPQIVEARAILTHDLQNRTKQDPDWSGRGTSYSKESTNSLNTFALEPTNSSATTEFETEKHPIVSSEMQVIDKSVVEEEPVIQNKNKELLVGTSSKILDQEYEEEDDEWLEDESSEMGGFTGTTIPLGNEDDVSFSDLEEDEGSVPTSSKTVAHNSDSSSTKDSRDWVELSRSASDSIKDGRSVGTERLGSEQPRGNNPENKDSNDWLDVDEVDVV